VAAISSANIFGVAKTARGTARQRIRGQLHPAFRQSQC
jgi:hypothetical protein